MAGELKGLEEEIRKAELYKSRGFRPIEAANHGDLRTALDLLDRAAKLLEDKCGYDLGESCPTCGADDCVPGCGRAMWLADYNAARNGHADTQG